MSILIWSLTEKDVVRKKDLVIDMLRVICRFAWNTSSVNLTELIDEWCLQQRENLGRNGYKSLNTSSLCAVFQLEKIIQSDANIAFNW